MSWYDINKKPEEQTRDAKVYSKAEKKKLLERDAVFYEKFLDRQYQKIATLDDLIKLPEKGTMIRLVTQQNYNLFSLFLFILQNSDVREVYLTTYSIDKNTVTGLEKIVKEFRTMKITILIASLVKHDKPVLRSRLIKLARNNKNVSFVEAFNHAKIIAARTKNNYYVVEGSGNLSINARIEAYTFDNCKGSFEFHKNWINEILHNAEGTKILHSKNCVAVK